MEFYINLPQETSANDLPDETKNEMLTDFDDIATSNIHNRAANSFGRVDHNVVIFGHVECIQGLDLFSRLIQNTLINGIWDTVVDQLCQDQAIFAFIEHFERVGGKREGISYIWVASKNSIDVPGKFCPFILIDGMCDI